MGSFWPISSLWPGDGERLSPHLRPCSLKEAERPEALRLERSNSKQVELVELSVVNEWMQQHNVEYVGLPSAPQLAQLIVR